MADSNEKIWHYATGDAQRGPVSKDELHTLLDNGTIAAETHVWKDGMEGWGPARAVPELGLPEAGANLKLGDSRKYDKINLKDDETGGDIDVRDFLASNEAQAPAKKRSSKPQRYDQPSFLESIGLGTFESAFFALVAVVAGIACAVKLEYWHGIVMGAGLFTIVVGQFAMIVRAFIKHWGWGLAVLFIPFAVWVYIVVDLKNAGKSLLLIIVGVAAVITPTQTGDFEQSPIYEHYEEFAEAFREEIEKQQEEMERDRNERLEPFNEES